MNYQIKQDLTRAISEVSNEMNVPNISKKKCKQLCRLKTSLQEALIQYLLLDSFETGQPCE